ncbi:hypothetical protein BS78_10G004100 [Paspalum vaginatum]|nr:hypothetical protein BS78_10G004100 [Paspalum vaginatum]
MKAQRKVTKVWVVDALSIRKMLMNSSMWWSKFHKNQLKYTRGYLIELMHSDTIFISNVTLLNSPAWNIHPVYSSNIVVQGVTILAPTRSPNTDGINPAGQLLHNGFRS